MTNQKLNLVKQAETILNSCKFCSVSSIDENGYPRICILGLIKNEGIKSFYFSTGTSSRKTKNYIKNPKAGVTFYKDGDSITLTGIMKIIKDKKIKNELWQDWFIEHFPNGGKDDPEYAIIKFESNKGTFWINNIFETFDL